jgi:magnesium transporter
MDPGPPVPTDQPAGAADGSPIVDCALYEGGQRRGGRVPLEVALDTARRSTGGFVWLGLYRPTAAEFDRVTQEFALHPLAVEDAVHAHQRPKLEQYGDLRFVVLKTVRYVDSAEVIEVGEVMLFLGPEFVITVRHGDASPLAQVRRALEARPELLDAGPAAVLYAVADRVVDDYATAIAGVDTDVDEVQEQVFDPTQPNPAERIYKLKREVLEFRRAVAPLAAPLDRLARATTDPAGHPLAEYFRDVHDHLLRITERVDSFNELLSDALNANVAQLTVQQNEDMRKITAWVAILAAITAIAGIYGMNFQFMPELNWRYGYPAVLTVMLTSSLVLYRGFRRNHWL